MNQRVIVIFEFNYGFDFDFDSGYDFYGFEISVSFFQFLTQKPPLSLTNQLWHVRAGLEIPTCSWNTLTMRSAYGSFTTERVLPLFIHMISVSMLGTVISLLLIIDLSWVSLFHGRGAILKLS